MGWLSRVRDEGQEGEGGGWGRHKSVKKGESRGTGRARLSKTG